jgi:phosphoglycerate dehydrogenase-like enzyme
MKIVIGMPLTSLQRELIEQAAPAAHILALSGPARPTVRFPEQMVSELAECDVLACYAVPANLPALAPRLRLIQMMFAGIDGAAADPATMASAIPLTNVSGVHGAVIAEYIMMSILAYAHQLHRCLRAQVRKHWIGVHEFASTVEPVRGKTLAVLGYGSIGRQTARLAQGLGIEVLALKRDPAEHRDFGWSLPGCGDPAGEIPRAWFGPDQREEILAQSDFIALTLPLTPATRHFVGARELAAMKPGAYLVNIGRGQVIDQTALIDALKSGRLGGAGLDVMVPEPLDRESPLWEMEQVLLTPHMSGARKGYIDDACRIFAENLRRLQSGQPLINLVDRALGY